MTILDLELAEILLHSCKYVIFDPQETILEVKRMRLKKTSEKFMINKLLNEQLIEIIKEKKNRHIIYICQKADPLDVLKTISPIAKDLSPTSKFYFNLISNREDHLKLKQFYAVYVQ